MKISSVILHQPAGLLRVLTDAGPEGHCTGVTASASDLDGVASILVRSDPADRERIWRAMHEMHSGLSTSLRAGIDVALWDLSAKIAGRPLFRHSGGFRDRVPVCLAGTAGGAVQAEGTAPNDRADRTDQAGHVDQAACEIVQEAKEAQQARYRAYRFGSIPDEAALIHLVREVRAAVGPDFPLVLDGRARCTVDEAIRIGGALDEADYFYFDHPRPRGDHTGGKQAAGAIDTPTSAEVRSPMEASQVMASQSADHLRAGVQSSGGFTDVLKSARCAEAFGAYCHLDGMGISDGFAHLHLAGALRNTPFLEMTGHEATSSFVRNAPRVKDGFIQVPDLPGLGMDIDLGAVSESTSESIEI